ncbi:MAG: hypothetical protein ABW250_18400, partial [Pyrinomonadaceae bacterium]
AFAIMLLLLGSRAAVAALALYLMLEWARRLMWKTGLVVVVPKERASILMLEYYEVFFPLALLLSSSTRHPGDLLVVAGHLLLFPGRARQVLKDGFKLTRQAMHKLSGDRS